MDESMLSEGETLLAEWRPAGRVFLKKLLTVGVFTTVFLVPIGLYFSEPNPLWFLAFPVAVAASVFVFGDYQEWFVRRNDHWLLTDRRILFLNPDDADDGAAIALDEIDALRLWPWSMTVRLRDQRTVTMDFLPDMRDIRASILETRDGRARGHHG